MAKKRGKKKHLVEIDLEKSSAPEEKSKTNPFLQLTNNIWKTATIVLFLLLVFLFATGGFTGTGISAYTIEAVSGDTVDFINTNLMQGGAEVELLESGAESGMVKMNILVNGGPMDVFVTPDGILMFTQAIDMTAPVPQRPEAQQQQQPPQPADIPKTDTPTVDLYVMSFCPFGNQAEDIMYPVYELLKDFADINVRYIVSLAGGEIRSLHGQPETDQNIREVCVMKNFGEDAFWTFMTYVNVNCGSTGNCWEAAALEAGAKVSTIENCLEANGLELMTLESEASMNAGVTGSPTLIINGVVAQVTRTPDAYKEAICSAYTDAPEECETVLSGAAAAATGNC